MAARFFGWLSERLFALSERMNDWAYHVGRWGLTEEAMRREDELFERMMSEKYPEWRRKP